MDDLVTAVGIAGRTVGPGHPCFIIAEAGVNHNGSVELAKRLIEAAAGAGADAVKFQTFRAERLASAAAPKAAYQARATTASESQLEMLRRLELPPEAFRELRDDCQRRGILFMSTPFDEESADLLDELGMAVFKIPSGELTNGSFLAYVAAKGKPMIVSTGMSSLEEVGSAVRAIEGAGNRHLILLHCVSDYPAHPAEVNLRAMRTMAEAYRVPVGYSDHTRGIEVALAAVALGACIVEKHLTLDRSLPGPDHRASLEPGELEALVRGIRVVEQALGDGRKMPAPSEAEAAAAARRSLIAACDIRSGTMLTPQMITIKRPGTGLPPAMRETLVGRIAKRDIPEGALLTLEMVG